MFDSSHKQK